MKSNHGSTPLLAKSISRDGKVITVSSHTADVMEAAAALFGTPEKPSSLAKQWCRFFSIDAAIAGFIATVRLAAFCHDWGKANDGFQDMLSRSGEQLLRHEQISAIFICWPSIWKWLGSSGPDMPLVLSAVLGHHLKCRDVDLGRSESEVDQPIRLRWDDVGFQQFLADTAPKLGLPLPVPDDVPKLCGFEAIHGSVDLDTLLDPVHDHLEDLDRALRGDADNLKQRRRMLWAVRAALIAADSAGSGLTRTGKGIAEWINAAFAHTLSGEQIEKEIIQRRLNGNPLRPFQEKAADREKLPERSLLLAPCGFGKTMAAWRWIAARLREKPYGRAIFLYPTRGTATEGYRDYAGLTGPEVSALMHGTADLDLDRIEGDISSERRINEARLFALRQWPKRIFSATVDQFLGFMQHSYGATCQLPLLADSVLVLDEIHSYDRGMWSALIEFLSAFPNIPVLCMTATLLNRRQNDLKTLKVKIVNGLELDGGAESDLTKAALYKRYRVRTVVTSREAKRAAMAALKEGHRVLWVVNTVDRCQAIAKDFAADFEAKQLTTRDGRPLFCYHSRYKLVDRQHWHEEVLKAFKPGDKAGGVIAITTQVCEMSLDLDADLLITEICPATALVQRMGRCCRDPDAHTNTRTGEVIIYPPAAILPYAKQDLEGVEAMLATMAAAVAVSQDDLSNHLDQISPSVEMPKACRFTQSGVWAAAGEEQFRDSDDINRPALLPCDVEEYGRLKDPKRRGKDSPWKADELVVNVPKKLAQDHGDPKLPPWLQMAFGGVYRTALGYCAGDLPTLLCV